jgi:hypothetical protein
MCAPEDGVTDLMAVETAQLHAVIGYQKSPPIARPRHPRLWSREHRSITLASSYVRTVALRMLDAQGIRMLYGTWAHMPACLTAEAHTSAT